MIILYLYRNLYYFINVNIITFNYDLIINNRNLIKNILKLIN